MPHFKSLLKLAILSVSLVSVSLLRQESRPYKEELQAYSFDYSAHKSPIAYETYETAIELFSKAKLISPVKDKYGSILLKKVRYLLIYLIITIANTCFNV